MKTPDLTAYDALDHIDQKLDFLQISLSYIIERFVGDETACGLNQIFWELSAQVKQVRDSISPDA